MKVGEHGWLIEAEDHALGHRWLRVWIMSGKGAITWTEDSALALRFARREDAVHFAWLHFDHCTVALITEHVWGAASAANKATP